MLVCSNPIQFAIFEQSKAARFVSVPVLPTVACCECKRRRLMLCIVTQKGQNLGETLVEETIPESRIELLYNIVYVFELLSKAP